MTDRQIPRPDSAARGIIALGRAAFVGLMALGLLAGTSRVLQGRAPGSLAAEGLDAVRIVLGYSLAGWLVMRVSREAGSLVASGLESARLGPRTDPIAAGVEEIRQAYRASDWPEARSRLVTFREAFPDRPEGERLRGELEEAERVAREQIRSRIEAARAVNDPERVIELRGQLGALLPEDGLRELDRELAKWFLHLIHGRLRTGTVREDVAGLAARVAETLDDTPEGASLRASLPTLRRAAGLCPRCGAPYKGVADACPTCRGTPPTAAPFAPANADDDLEAIEYVDEFGIGRLGE